MFDPRPKTSRRELFDREEELRSLEAFASKGSPIALCLGIRRIGKTSLVKVFINEAGYPSIYIDSRKLADYGYSRAGLYRLLSDEFTRLRGRLSRLAEYLAFIRGISVGAYTIELDPRSRELSVSSILERLNSYAADHGTIFIVVIDEAQELRYMRGKSLDIRKVLAYSYDNLDRVKFILTGSEIGLLNALLDFEDYESPLYGRARDEITVPRFSPEQSIEFLEQGFAEAGMNPPREVLEKVVERLDGIPGWLTLYGYKAVAKKQADVLDEVLNEAIRVALTELKRLTQNSETHRYVLRAVAMGFDTWSKIKKATEAWLGKRLHDETLRRSIRKLVATSIIAKEEGRYRFLDPVYQEAAKQL